MPKITELTELDAAPAAGDKLPLVDVDDVSQSADGTTKFVTFANLASELGGVTDHGALLGLDDDDHPQYHNNARGDARYSQLGHSHFHSGLAGLANDDHTIYLLADGTRALAGPMDMGGQALTNVNISSVTAAIGLTLGGTGATSAEAARTNLGLVAGGAGDVWVEKAGDTMTGTLQLDGFDTDGEVVLNIGSNFTLRRYGDNTVNNIGSYMIAAKSNSALLDILQLDYNGLTALKNLRGDVLYLYRNGQTESSIRFPAVNSAQYEFRINSTSNRRLQIQADHTNGTPTWPTTYVEIDHAAGAIGFFGVTPATKRTKISDPSGGATVDTEARAAINLLIDALEAFGFAATV